jgi:biotin synthase
LKPLIPAPNTRRKALTGEKPVTEAELAELLALEDPAACSALYARAYQVKTEYIGRRVSLRGLIECGNLCAKDCFYCGIRKSNAKSARYSLTRKEIADAARFAAEAGYGSIAIQSGEIESEAHTQFIEEVLHEIAPLGLGITLSLGEQNESVYKRWHEAGATRYLLRVETSDPEFYAELHPPECSFTRRVECLRSLKRCGYQTGTGVMIGVPGQTVEMLARDIAFFREIDADMIGMGPWIEHPDVPFPPAGKTVFDPQARLRLALNMIAAVRIELKDVNIAAATALQVLDPHGREKGLMAGANVIMPNVIEATRRKTYRLYEGKPDGDETSAAAREELTASISALGEEILWRQHGDSPHFRAAQVSAG